MNDFPWFVSYPKDVVRNVDQNRYESLRQFIEESFEKYADEPAYDNLGKTLTYRDVDQLSNAFAAYLQSLGLVKGDRIAIQMPNVLQYPVAMFGAIRAGLVIVNTNPLYTEREMEHQFNDSGAKAIIILANFAFKLQPILANTKIEHVFVTEIGDLVGGLKGSFVNFAVKHIKKMVPQFNLPSAISFKKALKKGSAMKLNRPDIQRDDIAMLQYTGGTTGVSKGATLSHFNLVTNVLQTFEFIRPILNERGEIVITALPLYHVFACSINCLCMLMIGARNILITNPRDMKAFLGEMSKYPFTVVTGVNTLFNGILNHPDVSKVNFDALKCTVGGGMAVLTDTANKWKEVTGVPIIEGYGLSETSPVLTVNPTDGTERIGFIGIPVPDTEVAIMDDDGNKLPAGERGEICARGPQVMRGYWGRENETSNVFHEGGWFKTGDIGVMDETGFFKIVDRKKDMILVSGFNVFPNEVEDVVTKHPGVLEAAAIGVPDAKSNEAVKLFVVKSDASLTSDEVKSHCKENMAGYKVPRHIEFIEELPKSNVGKILRRILKERDEKKRNKG